ncbi:solute carrier family 46 member 3-like [Haliotis rufescens]|uniref:solute carrier family 46 member 3-like n=1 Tax=Haliotis rufescens TaxID=6454 RepID=UPI00201F9873|nr:solute carrier family 46 member 3-like [Haliotis rufescens]
MDERTPLLGGSANRPDVRGFLQDGEGDPLLTRASTDAEFKGHIIADVEVRVNARPKSAPPLRRTLIVNDDEDTTSAQRHRPKTSLGDQEEMDDDDWVGWALNRQKSRNNEDEEFLNKDTNRKEDSPKTQVVNLILMNIILIIWSIAIHIHGPAWSQYFFHRLEEEVFGNTSRSSDGNNSSYDASYCENPSLNASDSNGTNSLQEKAEQLQTTWSIRFTVTGCPISLVSTVIFSAYSDYFGRKVLFLIPMIGTLLNFVLTTAVIHWSLSFYILFIGSVIGSICSTELFTIACFAYIADNTSPEGSRTTGLVVMGITQTLTNAALATGVGYYIQLEGYFLPCVTSIAILLLAVLAVVVILPESKKTPSSSVLRKQKKKERKLLTPLGAIKNVFGFYFTEGTVKTRIMFSILLLAMAFHKIASKTGSIGTLWEMTWPLCWSPEMMGYYGTGASIFSELIKIPLLKLYQCCFNDVLIAIWSNLAVVGANILKAFATNNFLMYGVAAVGSFDVALISAIQSIMSAMAGPDRQGALFGSLSIIDIICSLVGTPVFSEIYQYTLNIFKGVSYLVVAGFQAVATIMIVIYAVLSRMGYHTKVEHISINDNQTEPKSTTPTEDDDQV